MTYFQLSQSNKKAYPNSLLLPPLPQQDVKTYRSASNHQLNLTPIRTHQRTKLLHDALQNTQPVVARERLEEVLDNAVFVLAAQVLLQLGHNLLLVRDRQRRRAQQRRQLRIFLEHAAERVERLGGRFERGGLCGCGVLFAWKNLISDCGT